MNQKLRLKGTKGLTLLEIIISIGIFALLATAISLVFNRSLFVYRASTDKNSAAQKAQTALEWLVRDISSARCIYEANTTSIALSSPDWGYVKYFLDEENPTALMRSDPTDCTAFHLISEEIESFSLNYYDSANQPTAVTAEIKTVEINLTTAVDNQSFDLYGVAAPEASSLDCLWAKAYGGSDSESFRSLRQTQDGGYIFGGDTSSFSPTPDFLFIKTNSNGTIQWAKTYTSSSGDYLRSVQQTLDEGYILGGLTNSFGPGFFAFLVVKTDSQGVAQWARTYGGSQWDSLNFLQQTLDGGYILGGTANSFGAGSHDFFLVKTNSDGDVGPAYPGTWARTYGGTGSDYFSSLQQTPDKGYILGGYTNSFGAGSYDFLLIKTNSNGVIQWAKTYGDQGAETFYALQQTQDGGYIFGGYSNSFGPGAYAFLVVKTDSQGNREWARTYGGTGTDFLSSLQQTQDGGYIFGGRTNSFGVLFNDFLLLKTNSDGNVGPIYPGTWARTYGGTVNDLLQSLQQTQDGGYILGGNSNSFSPLGDTDFLLIKTGAQGNLDCCAIVGDVTPQVDTNLVSPVTSEYDGDPDNPTNDFTVTTQQDGVDFTLTTQSVSLEEIDVSPTTTSVCPE